MKTPKTALVLALMVLGSNYSSGKFHPPQAVQTVSADPTYYEIGSFIRTWELFYFIPLLKLYEVKLYCSRTSDQILADFRRKGSPSYGQEKRIDQIALFLTDPQNQYDLKLTFRTLISKKSFAKEKAALQRTLSAAGFQVTDDWQLLEKKEHQEDVNRYVSNLMGFTKSQASSFYAKRKKGDQFSLHLGQSATIEYSIFQGNPHDEQETILLSKTDLLRGIILTFISEAYCEQELKQTLPPALMAKLL